VQARLRSRGAPLAIAAILTAAACTRAVPGVSPAPSAPAVSAVVEDSFVSRALGVRKRALVYLPPSYARDVTRRYPVAYYLHGLWGSESDWTRSGRLHVTMDSLIAAGGREMIVVMPDGDDGWYTTWNRLLTWRDCADRPRQTAEEAERYCVAWARYDEYVARDLVARVDSVFRTVARRDARGIAGLSMGGYGAVTLALRYPEVFGAAASHSGVLSPLYRGTDSIAGRPAYASDEEALRTTWGPRFWSYLAPAFGEDTAGWWARDPARLAKRLHERGGTMPALYADAGIADRLVIAQNRAFRAEMESLGVPLAYAEWPGAHDWNYWRAHVDESLAWLADRIAR
jgi:S-formylglutathione hydrolase FrmB